MNIDRKNFLKIFGFSLFGVATGKIADLYAKSSTLVSKKALSALNRAKPRKKKKKELAMVVDLRKCKDGCTKCIEACNHIHNVPDLGNSKDAVKWIWKEPYENAFLDQENLFMKDEYKNKHVPILCNHCENPPCVEVCPTQATFINDSGIVMMDWHRCIGCRYCMAACPYGSRSFNWVDPRPFIKDPNPDFPTRTKGVVEKCIFCDDRVSQGLEPSCVEVCPEKALIFGDLNDPDSEVRKVLKEYYSIRRKPQLGTNPKVYYLV